ncbi:MAG: hypothetical protein L0287_05095 [Anaerolineae bacterium]|nr:hypothetical protein [Anaerolineae bacterium]
MVYSEVFETRKSQNRPKMRSSLHNFLLFQCLLFGFMPHSSAEAQPRIFAEGVISTGDHESHPAFSPDGRMLMFVKMAPDFSKWTLFVSYYRSSEYYPTLADNGSMYFGSRREGGKGATDIYFSRLEDGKYRTAMNVGEAINTPGNEFEPFIAPDESLLIFMATPTEALDQTDLWISHHLEGQWTNALKLPVPFNSAAMEFSPKISLDGKQLFFSSSRNKHDATFARPERTGEMRQRIRSAGNGLLDIYQVDFSALRKALASQPPH